MDNAGAGEKRRVENGSAAALSKRQRVLLAFREGLERYFSPP